MDLFDVMMKRRSVRNFEDRPVPRRLKDELLRAACSAPSGGNVQPLAVVTVEEEANRKALSDMVGHQPWVRNAPLSLVFCIDFYRLKRWAAQFDVEFLGERILNWFLIAYADVMCAAQNVVVLAEERGLGSVYVGTIQSSIAAARRHFGMPEYVLPVMVLSLGYPRSVPTGIPKLPVGALVHSERYRVPDDDEIRAAFESKYGDITDDVDRYFARAYVEVVEADKQHDADWTDRAKEKMGKLGIRSNAEFLFGLRYPQRTMLRLNERFVASLKDAGFDFLSGQ